MRVPGRARRAAFVVLILCIALYFFGSNQARAGAVLSPEGHWEGAIEVPGTSLGVIVELILTDGEWAGSIDIPLQGASGLPLTSFAVHGDSVRFAIQGIPGDPTFHGVLADSSGVESIRGSFKQATATFPFWLGREESAQLNRPQEPQAPSPYEVEEVGYDHGEIHLAATLTLPKGEGPFPAVLLLTGSGPQDRDEALMGHRPFLVLADHLTRAGIAVLRADDRGVGGSTGIYAEATISDFADDALAGLRYLASRPEVDSQRVGLAGHSEGGVTGPLAAQRAPDEVAFVICLAGTGVPLDEVLVLQTELMGRTAGLSDEWLAGQREIQSRLLKLVGQGASADEQREPLLELIRYQLTLQTGEAPPQDRVDTIYRQESRRLAGPWYRHAINLDPRDALRELKCPVLAINGERDLQVDAAQNLVQIELALREGGNEDFSIRLLPRLNHLFQTAETGMVAEYAAIEETMSPVVLDLIRDWILDRFADGR